MTKKAIIQQINRLSRMSVDALNYTRKFQISGMKEWHEGQMLAFNTAAAQLAVAVGDASYIWDKPAALALAA